MSSYSILYGSTYYSMGQILLDHPISYAFTATADVPVVYLQQFWKPVSKVPETKDTIRFKLNTQEIVYTVDMFCDTLKLLVETPYNPFIAPVNIKIIESFMNRVCHQGVVDKVSAFFTKFLAQQWQTMFKWNFMNCVFQKKDVIQYSRFTKLIISDLMKKYPSISPRIEEDYLSIKDDIPLVSVYTIGNVTVQGMLIPDAFLTNEICATDDYKEYETVFVRISSREEEEAKCRRNKFTTQIAKVTIKQKQVVEGERDKDSYADKFAASMLHDDDDDSGTKIEPRSHKEHPNFVDDDDDNKEGKKDEKKYNKMGSLEIRTEKMQTTIPIPPRSPRIILSSDKNINQELMVTVSPSTTTSPKDPHKKEIFPTIHGKVDHVLNEIVPQIAKKDTNDLIESNLKRAVANIFIQERDAFQAENVIQVHPTITTSTDTTSSADLQQKLYSKMMRSLQDQANDPTLWEVLKRNITPRVLGSLTHQRSIIRDMERKYVTTDEFWKVHGKVDHVLNEIVPQIAKKDTNDLIESNLKRAVANIFIQERDAFQAEVPALVSKEFDTHAPMIIEELFK
ncbi:hypothetical protein Tco_0693726 [Tanacetum coccineum]